MRRFASTAAAVLLALVSHPAGATAPEVPPALMFDGKPVDPFCFQQDTGVPFDPAGCRPDDVVIVPNEAGWNDSPYWISQSFRWDDLEDDAPVRGWVAYRPIGTLDSGQWAGATVVETAYSGGGTGFFTSVDIVRRQDSGKMVTETVLAGGDRCNGGIAGVEVADNTVLTAIHVTPHDLLGIAFYPAEPPFEAYDDIVACASCCVGTLMLVNETPGLVTLGGGLEGGFSEDPDTPQGCLDAILAETPNVLNRAALDHLAGLVRERCVRP